MTTWKELEINFRQIPDPYFNLRADWSDQTACPNHWNLAGGSQNTRDRFEILARSAGSKLPTSQTVLSKYPNEFLKEPDDLIRWLTAVKQLTNRFKCGPVCLLSDESKQELTGHMYTGTIDEIIEASALLCLQLATEDESTTVDAKCSARVSIDDIDSFEKVREVKTQDISHFLEKGRINILERKIKLALQEFLTAESLQGDWGGEDDDFYTSNLILNGRRTPTAFLLKGPAIKSKKLEIAHCGKNGDQIVRLFQAPAQLFVLQFIGPISENVVKDIDAKTRLLQREGREATFCIIDGQDTARLLYAYRKLSGCT